MSQQPLILLVEDNADDVLFWELASARAGLATAVQVAQDGVEAINWLSGDPPSDGRRPTHVLLDLKLPRKSGLEVLAWLRQRPEYERLPVIVLTSSQEKSDILRARELGITTYLVKPVSLPELVEMVRSIATTWNLELSSRG